MTCTTSQSAHTRRTKLFHWLSRTVLMFVLGLCSLGVQCAFAQESWTKIADEYGSFTFSGTKTVRYGTGSSWVQMSVTSSGDCTNGFFGSDPAPTLNKQCDVLNTNVAASTRGTTRA